MSTPEYVKKAQNRYNSKHDLIQLKLPKGTKDRIRAITDESFNAYITKLVLDSLKTPYNATESNEIPLGDKDTVEEERREIKPNIANLYELYNGKLSDIMTQLEIRDKYGNDVLVELLKFYNASKK